MPPLDYPLIDRLNNAQERLVEIKDDIMDLDDLYMEYNEERTEYNRWIEKINYDMLQYERNSFIYQQCQKRINKLYQQILVIDDIKEDLENQRKLFEEEEKNLEEYLSHIAQEL